MGVPGGPRPYEMEASVCDLEGNTNKILKKKNAVTIADRARNNFFFFFLNFFLEALAQCF